MKNMKFILSVALCLVWANASFSQNINWKSLAAGQKHIVNLNAGFDYSFAAGAGYGYQLNTKIPAVLSVEYSMPSGRDIFDDFKTKIGAQAKVVQWGSFLATARLYGNFRRYESSLVRIASFGAEASVACGYYQSRWFAAAECGFDKAIATHLKNSDTAREDFPEIQDGWYVPTAGNFSYGIQGGFSVKKLDFYLKLGKVLTQDFSTAPSVPFYFQLGANRRF